MACGHGEFFVTLHHVSQLKAVNRNECKSEPLKTHGGGGVAPRHRFSLI